MNHSPPSLSCEEIRNIDIRAIRDFKIPGLVLMENAGRNTAELLIELGIDGPVLILAGKGNNGGDGAVILRHLKNQGVDARFLLCANPDELTGDAAANYQTLRAARWEGETWGKTVSSDSIQHALSAADWVVDALLGTGSTGPLREPYFTLVQAMNRSQKRILAVDLPTGLDGDSGIPGTPCVHAHHTATFVAWKKGFLNPLAAPHIGNVHVIDIGIPQVMLDPNFSPQTDSSQNSP